MLLVLGKNRKGGQIVVQYPGPKNLKKCLPENPPKMCFGAKVVEKWPSQKFWTKLFLSESIQNVLKRILIWKFRNRKIFPVTIFQGLSHFFHPCGQFIKCWKTLKFLDEKIKVVENLTESYLYTWHWMWKKITEDPYNNTDTYTINLRQKRKNIANYMIWCKILLIRLKLSSSNISLIEIRVAIEGGQRPKRGPILAFSDTFFGAEGAENWELLEIFWENLG